jgi:hypothetical protein
MFKMTAVDAAFLGVIGFALLLNPLALLITGVCLTAVYLNKLSLHWNIAAIICVIGANVAAMVACYGWQLTISIWVIGSCLTYWRVSAHD